MKKISPSLTLLALAINAFAIGSTEFISVGLMPMIVNTFNISLSQAGLTVSLYALGVTVGAPLLTILTGTWNRKTLMVSIMGLFIIGNLLSAFAPTFLLLLVGRVLASLAHGIFMSISTVIAADVVRPEKRASAIALMFTGLTVATVIGVPLGTFIGQHSNWHMSFVFIVVIGLIGLIATSILVPKGLPIPGKINLSGLARIFTNKSILMSLFITAFGYGGTFRFSASTVVIILVAYGVMVAIGNSLGGHLANKNILPALQKMFAALALSLLFLFISAILASQPLGLIATLLLGLFAFINVPGLQLYVVQLAEKFTPKDITLVSAFNIAAFNVGITLGSFVGGQISKGSSVVFTPLGGIIIILLAMFLIRLAQKDQASKL
ncbi:Sugar efflux transporter SotB [Lactococcus lactis subsp. lactis]|uniref:MFS transporter n=2 Tax=Lactococcus lactis TaxID=1358 RepID=A0A2A5SJH3_LACLH|nr:MFS transporter [Lactococcus lactis]KAA8705004.1 MFS transporter [Lactococcus lactis subsp. hordniae]KSU06153.1 Sugar efflux transporter SotB [Lactococcus lactis subsp. lactis]MCT3134230.1 MFS transporter [Lactococcus lactis]PCS13634.1 sugar efflux transporter [Lactococcus lactis subsp. hordniae]